MIFYNVIAFNASIRFEPGANILPVKESIIAKLDELGLEKDFYQKVDIHIHVPEGAIPKDGPSAGITIAIAITSALIKMPVRGDLAMTGEITLRGRVLPIGGLKEKLLAAHRNGIKKVIIPMENKKDIKEVPGKIMKLLDVISVEHMDEVIAEAIIMKPGHIVSNVRHEEELSGLNDGESVVTH